MERTSTNIDAAERPAVSALYRDDGTILLTTGIALPPVTGSIAARLGHWARRTPDAVYMSEGERRITYAEAEVRRRNLSARLLSLGAEGALMIVGENGINHALVMLAATAIGIPVAVITPAYISGGAEPSAKFRRVLDTIAPARILADDPVAVERALAALGRTEAVHPLHDLDWLDRQVAADPALVDAAGAAVAPDSVAKLLFTSGSTGTARAVTVTQRMMVSNMEALALVWPFLAERPPVLVDWLPWSHTFGGNCCFNIALWFGGHLHVDKGRPTPARIGHTVDAIRRHKPTVYFNVPIGYEMLLPRLEADPALAEQFFGGLDFLFTAGAPMPQSLRGRLEAVAMAAVGRCPNLTGGWGSTETAPFSTVLCFPAPEAANLGIPIPGTTIKLVPEGDRYELRVRGPNVTPGYWNDAAGSETAFDEEGFYRIGDAGKLADPGDPAAGILFDGRVAENFKLSSGTFVNVGALRLAIISAGEKLISDLVITGEGRNELAALLFLNTASCRAFLDEAGRGEIDDRCAANHPAIIDRLKTVLSAFNRSESGSSRRITRFLVADEAPSAADEEITEKGYLNQRRIRVRRAALIDRIHTEGVVV